MTSSPTVYTRGHLLKFRGDVRLGGHDGGACPRPHWEWPLSRGPTLCHPDHRKGPWVQGQSPQSERTEASRWMSGSPASRGSRSAWHTLCPALPGLPAAAAAQVCGRACWPGCGVALPPPLSREGPSEGSEAAAPAESAGPARCPRGSSELLVSLNLWPGSPGALGEA